MRGVGVGADGTEEEEAEQVDECVSKEYEGEEKLELEAKDFDDCVSIGAKVGAVEGRLRGVRCGV